MKLCVTPVVNHELPREVLMHGSGPVQPPSLQLKSTQVIQLFCDINVVNVLVYPFAYRSRRRRRTINRRRGGIESGCWRGIRDDNSFGDLGFSGRGELSCLFGLSTSQIFSDDSAALIRGGFEQAELDVLLLLPECDKIADLQTTLIAATNKKD